MNEEVLGNSATRPLPEGGALDMVERIMYPLACVTGRQMSIDEKNRRRIR